MGQDRFSSMLFSMCLHLGIVALVLLWPLPEPKLKDFKPPLSAGLVTLGKAGKMTPNAKKMEPKESRAPEKTAVQKQEETTAQEVPPQPTALENPQAEVPQKPEVKPLDKVEPPKPEPPKVEPPKEPPAPPEPPTPDVNAIKVPKEDIKKPPQKNATAQKPPEKEVKKPEEPKKEAAKPAETKKAEEKKTDSKKATPPKADAKKKSSVADALKGLEKEVKKSGSADGGTTKKTGKTSGTLSSALDDLGTEIGGSGNDAEGTGPGGSGGDGVGNLGPYEAVIVQSVMPNWQLPPRADRRSLSAVVYIVVEPDGTISQARLVQSSGDRLFDSTLMSAIRLTGVLDEPPPNGRGLDADVIFETPR
ncbi:cell envelope integrity protein TolA [Desulfovibrio cuneatus]|uniref:cell envelope integrity protein TolA n=1 Tax=Desulfovibrio cuneatus TaxID=159728 RepID=UPI000411CD6B|nr:cell envelope integrity protein TolA [Desulfovibrio cuneatus]